MTAATSTHDAPVRLTLPRSLVCDLAKTALLCFFATTTAGLAVAMPFVYFRSAADASPGAGGVLSLDGERVPGPPLGAIQGAVVRGAARVLALPPPPPVADEHAGGDEASPPFPRGEAFERLLDELLDDEENELA